MVGKQVMVKGVKVNVDESALDDFELLGDLGDLQDGQASALPRVFRRLLGADYERVLESLRGENGRVSIEAAADFVKVLFERLAPNS